RGADDEGAFESEAAARRVEDAGDRSARLRPTGPHRPRRDGKSTRTDRLRNSRAGRRRGRARPALASGPAAAAPAIAARPVRIGAGCLRRANRRGARTRAAARLRDGDARIGERTRGGGGTFAPALGRPGRDRTRELAAGGRTD